MKNSSLLVLCLTWSYCAFAGCEHSENAFRCVEYVRNYDGDTITFNIKGVHPIIGKNISLRVLGVDTPEIKGKSSCEKQKAKEAQAFVEKILRTAKQIELVNVQKDKYFRLLGDVHADGKSLREMLIGQGLAYKYDGGAKAQSNWCAGFIRLPASKKGGQP